MLSENFGSLRTFLMHSNLAVILGINYPKSDVKGPVPQTRYVAGDFPRQARRVAFISSISCMRKSIVIEWY